MLEPERLPGGPPWRVSPALTVFLTGRECPFGCVYCDLWRYTLPGPTPPGALPAQLARALAEFTPGQLAGTTIKLYNASNFFDAQAVPRPDWPALVDLVAPFDRIVVENHPRLVTPVVRRFAAGLVGQLEVAMGLETAHPEALPRLGKGMTLAHFDRAAAALRAWGIGLRVFVLVGAPFVPAGEQLPWVVRSVAHAVAQGAGHVSLIPLRIDTLGELAPRPSGELLEAALVASQEAVAGSGAVVTADLWDLDRLGATPELRARLEQRNLWAEGTYA